VEKSSLGKWMRRIAAGLVAFVVVAGGFGVVRGASIIASDFLTPRPIDPGPEHEIELVGAGRIALPSNAETAQAGVWGIVGEDGAYGQMAAVIATTGDTVERSFRTLEGHFVAGDLVTIDPYAVGTDPLEAFGMAFDNVRLPGELGVNPAWLIGGERDTWVILIHGEGLDERAQALRILPALADGGFPALVITYRNDSAAPDDGGHYRWGLSEWKDVDVAVEYALSRGARSVILYGYGMGATIAMMYLHQSDLVGSVLGAVLDSPVLDLGAAVDARGDADGVPGIIVGAAKEGARLRYGISWRALNQIERAAEFAIPMLLLQGEEDMLAPVELADRFAAALPDLVTYERFPAAGHADVWNVDPERYGDAVLEFVLGVTPDN
jgi:pimeloyl-ACP methyl ester carboxylesterase